MLVRTHTKILKVVNSGEWKNRVFISFYFLTSPNHLYSSIYYLYSSMSVEVNLVPGTGKSKISGCHKKSYFLLLSQPSKVVPDGIHFFQVWFRDPDPLHFVALPSSTSESQVFPRRCTHPCIPETEKMTPWEDRMGRAWKSHTSVFPTSTLVRSLSLSHI